MSGHDPLRDREALRRALGPAAAPLAAWRAGPPPEALVETTLRRARAELRAAGDESGSRAGAAAARPSAPPGRVPRGWAARAGAAGWPAGFHRELARLLGVALVPGALLLSLHLVLLLRAPALLERWLPEPLASALPVLYALAALGGLALVVGSLPILAHARACRRLVLPRETLA